MKALTITIRMLVLAALAASFVGGNVAVAEDSSDIDTMRARLELMLLDTRSAMYDYSETLTWVDEEIVIERANLVRIEGELLRGRIPRDAIRELWAIDDRVDVLEDHVDAVDARLPNVHVTLEYVAVTAQRLGFRDLFRRANVAMEFAAGLERSTDRCYFDINFLRSEIERIIREN